MTRKIRWRSIALALGVPRSEVLLHARLERRGHKRYGNALSSRNRWTMAGLHDWAEGFRPIIYREPTIGTIMKISFRNSMGDP